MWFDVPLPPQDIEESKRSSKPGAAMTDTRFPLHSSSIPAPKTVNMQANGVVSERKRISGTARAVVAAVVATCTEAPWAALPFTGTEDGSLQVGAGVTTGVMLQLKLTVPENDPTAVNDRPKSAVCPALIVWDVGDPGEEVMVKSGAA